MKICEECQKYHVEIIEKNCEKGIEIEDCCFDECESGHPTFRPELPENLQNMTGKLTEKTSHVEGPEWGWVYLFTYKSYYWWLSCSDLGQGYCSKKRPDDSEMCDIHYEPWLWVDNLEAWVGGLIDFGGGRPAHNCGGDGGQVNSKRNGECLVHYEDAPEVWEDGWLWCSHAETGVTDCIYRTQYMVLDYVPVERKRCLLESLLRIFRLHTP